MPTCLHAEVVSARRRVRRSLGVGESGSDALRVASADDYQTYRDTVKNIDKQALVKVQDERPLDWIPVRLGGGEYPKALALVRQGSGSLDQPAPKLLRTGRQVGRKIIYDKFHIIRYLHPPQADSTKSARARSATPGADSERPSRATCPPMAEKSVLLARRVRASTPAYTEACLRRSYAQAGRWRYGPQTGQGSRNIGRHPHCLPNALQSASAQGILRSPAVYTYRGCALKFWVDWKAQFKRSRLQSYRRFVAMAEKHLDGILILLRQPVRL